MRDLPDYVIRDKVVAVGVVGIDLPKSPSGVGSVNTRLFDDVENALSLKVVSGSLPPPDAPNPCIEVHASENPKNSVPMASKLAVTDHRKGEEMGKGSRNDRLADDPSSAACFPTRARADLKDGLCKSRARGAARGRKNARA